jgi:hypothetical protein
MIQLPVINHDLHPQDIWRAKAYKNRIRKQALEALAATDLSA